MKLPKSILIGDTTWKIVEKRFISKGTAGLCVYETETIYIKSTLDFPEKLSTLVHEILHCLEADDSIEIPHALIYKLEHPIAQLIIDNFL